MSLALRSTEYLDPEDFPEHIKYLVQKEKESEEQEKRQREIERNTCKVATGFSVMVWVPIQSVLSVSFILFFLKNLKV